MEEIAAQVWRGRPPLPGRDAIHRPVGREANRKKLEKHFEIVVTDDELRWSRKQERSEAEARLDGLYVVRTSLRADALGADAVVAAYKSLVRVERAFRSLKTTQLRVRPVYVYSEEHVRGHAFLCLLTYYVEWLLRRKLAPLLFEDAERDAAAARRVSPVEPAQVSLAVEAKADTKRTPDGLAVQSLRTLLDHLGSLTFNQVTLLQDDQHEFRLLAKPTPLQAKAFAMLGVDPDRLVSSTMAG